MENKIQLKVNVENLEEGIEKAKQLIELLERVNSLIESLKGVKA